MKASLILWGENLKICRNSKDEQERWQEEVVFKEVSKIVSQTNCQTTKNWKSDDEVIEI